MKLMPYIHRRPFSLKLMLEAMKHGTMLVVKTKEQSQVNKQINEEYNDKMWNFAEKNYV